MVSRIYKTNLYTAYKYYCEQCIDPPCLVKCSGQGGGFVSCSPKYIIKKQNNFLPPPLQFSFLKAISLNYVLKGSVQQKLRWVKTGVNRWIWPLNRALDIVLSLKRVFIFFIAYFRFWSVLPTVQVSSGIIGEAV